MIEYISILLAILFFNFVLIVLGVKPVYVIIIGNSLYIAFVLTVFFKLVMGVMLK